MMAEGLPHRMKMTTFCARYGVTSRHRHGADLATKCNQLISMIKEESKANGLSSSSQCNMKWVVGTADVRFSEGARQVMEERGREGRERAARIIQIWWGRRSRMLAGTNTRDLNIILQMICFYGLDKVTVCWLMDFSKLFLLDMSPTTAT